MSNFGKEASTGDLDSDVTDLAGTGTTSYPAAEISEEDTDASASED